MYNSELLPLIVHYQQHSMDTFTPIYEVFGKLIAYYGSRLRDEDAQQELNVFLVELLYAIPLERFPEDHTLGLQKYIAASLRNRYIALSKRRQLHQALFVELCEEMACDTTSFEENTALFHAISRLSQKQKQMICYKFLYGYSESEIAERLHISRQAVNRLVGRGLAALREFYEV